MTIEISLKSISNLTHKSEDAKLRALWLLHRLLALAQSLVQHLSLDLKT